MRVTMDAVWDRTTRVLATRGRVIAGMAAAMLFVPSAIRALLPATPGAGGDPGRALLAGLVALASVLIALWGQLTLTVLAADAPDVPDAIAGERARVDGPWGNGPAAAAPAPSAIAALRQAARRLPVTIGLAAIALVAVFILFVPVGIALVRGGVDPAGMTGGGMIAMPAGVARFVTIYSLAFTLLALGLAARLCVLYPVVLFERRGVRAYARAWALTRGYGLRLFGVLILYVIVLLVATGAVRFVVGAAAALLLGPGAGTVAVALVAVAAVGAALSMVAVSFVACLYVALRDSLHGGPAGR